MHIFASSQISGWGVQIFAEGEEEEDEEVAGRGGERKRRRNPNLTAAATKFPTLNVAAAARLREEIMHGT